MLTYIVSIKMPLTDRLLQSFLSLLPRTSRLVQRVTLSRNLIANYPLALAKTSTSPAIVAEQPIRANSDLLLLSAEECFFSTGLAGSSAAEEQRVREEMARLSQQYEALNPDFMARTQIVIQVLANAQQGMPMKEYADYVLGGEGAGLPKIDINSRFLLELHQAWEAGSKATFEVLKRELLKRTEDDQFLSAAGKVRAVVRDAGDARFKFAAPFLEQLHHSPSPNCSFDLLHLPHRRAPFVRIRAVRDIKEGEKATLSYGKLNNYELLLRYGFTVRDNPESVFMLPLPLEPLIAAFPGNPEWKHKAFLRRGLRLRGYVRILPSGELCPQDLLVLRILVNDSARPSEKQEQSDAMDGPIYHFVGQHARGLRRNIRINSLKSTTNPQVRRLEEQQTAILDAFLSRHPQA